MKAKILTLLPILLLTILTPVGAVSARDGGNNRSGGHGDENRVRVENRVENEDEEENEVENAEIAGQQFEIRGEITAVSGNSFTVSGQTIMVDPSRVANFEQKGVLAVGQMVKVEGIIRGGTRFAREIKVMEPGVGQEFRVEIKGTPSASIIPTTGSATPSASQQNIRVEVKAQGPVGQITSFLEQVLTSLRNLVH